VFGSYRKPSAGERFARAGASGEKTSVMSAVELVEKEQLLSHVFPSLDSLAIGDLSDICLETHYNADELIAQEGSYASGVYIVQSGLVKIGKYAERGSGKRVFRFLGVGELLGLEAVVLEYSTNVQYAKTIMESTLIFVERGNLLAFKDAHPVLCSDFCRWLAREVVMLEFKLTRDAVESLDRNLALLLIALAHNYGMNTDDGVVVDLPISRQIIADMLGVSIETLMRSLKRFRERKLLTTSGRRITITGFDDLKERARTTPFYISIIEDSL
jgi:CRP-like cAMP-binding protein